MAESRVDFGKSERDLVVYVAASLLGASCTCGQSDCDVLAAQQMLALLLAAKIMDSVMAFQQQVALTAAFREVFG